MKKFSYLFILVALLFFGCNSDDDRVEPKPESGLEATETFYEVPGDLKAYYTEVDFSLKGEALYEDLAILSISKHTGFLSYGQRHNYLYKADEDPNHPANVVLIYSGESRDKREYESDSNSHEPHTFNTEHVYPQSMLEGEAPNDLHVMRVADIDINIMRWNHPFTGGEGKYGLKGEAFFPGDEWRGDVARILMYMNLRYDEPFAPMGGLDLFLQWNAEDPVSAIEIQRNNIIENAQGNRNPFIDNPHLATRIWEGEEADNRWGGEAREADSEAPSVPQNLSVEEVSFETVRLSWEASTDNVGIAKYNVQVDGEFYTAVSSISVTVEGLWPGETYAFTITAADSAGNTSAASDAVEGTTTPDNENPTVPQNLSVSYIGVTSATFSWEASTDNAGIQGYDIHINGDLYKTVSGTEYTVATFTGETDYTVTVAARDIYDNTSELSSPVDFTTLTADANTAAGELIISEYFEGYSYNKAIEIGNPTGEAIDLSSYTLMKITNTETEWKSEYQLQGTIAAGAVIVLAHAQASLSGINNAADYSIDHQIITFNGNDPIGLFKDGQLIDMFGYVGGHDFAKDTNMRRKAGIINPNTEFTEDEWEVYGPEDTEGLGTL